MDPSPLVTARLRKARAVQRHPADHPEVLEAARLYAVERSCDVLRRLMVDVPPLLPDEYARITALIPSADRLAVSA